ncbi:MAG: zinc-binding dehydrogenase [Phycisphaeraceae bacterium]|nr:zinc-binding dehydrogenase [Phycisphaerales bacterium]MCB9860255.1 zinc-binding dehydrogenase [Phycisphaeraceae bacterium]
MNALVCTKQAQPGERVAPNIEFQTDWPDIDAPAPGEVVLRTLASALNHMDLWVGKGIPGVDLLWPRVSGCDACAEVIAAGEGVDPAWVGRRVIVNAACRVPDRVRPDDPPASTLAPNYELIGEHHNGMHRAQFCAPAANIVDVGDADPVQAAAFGLTALTAWSMIVTKGELRSGQSVLITGIGGGVATSALSIASHFGCPVCVTSRHQWKLDRAMELGATHAILDEGQDWSRDVRAWTNKRGVDMAVDSTGKATHLKCIKSLARGGAYVTPGCTSGPDAVTDLARVFWNQLRLLGSTMGSNEEFAEVVSLFRAGTLAPAVDQVFGARDGRQAYERLEAANQFGKVVIDWR